MSLSLWAANPIVPGIGLTDPHGVVFDDRVYVFATHDAFQNSRKFVMTNWWLWSSADLVNWRQECTLDPRDTFIGKPFNDCWATFGVRHDSKYYWYFSAGPRQIGVVMADSPAGPWKDPLGKPLVPEGLVPTEARDPDIFVDDDGKAYMVFGTYDYFIARLNGDMVSLAEKPQAVPIADKFGPYGAGRTDDKPSLHKRKGIYYLSWSSFYAMSTNVYGPYVYKGSVIVPENVSPEFQVDKAVRKYDLWHDRHGNFFEMHHQWYYIFNDKSMPGSNSRFRDACLGYLHYRENGEMAPIRLDKIGVGQYDASRPRIEAEDFFDLEQGQVRESPAGGFEVRDLKSGSHLVYPNVMNLPPKSVCALRVAAMTAGSTIEIHANNPRGALLGICKVPDTGDEFQTVSTVLNNAGGTNSICLVVKGRAENSLRLDWLSFMPQPETPPAYDASVPKPTFSDVSYGPHARNVLDFWKADSDGPAPWVFVIHGGGWTSHSKEFVNRFVDVPGLLKAGISVVAINYRYTRMAKADGVEPAVKAPMADCARALQFVRSKAKEWNLDPQRVGAAGGSAGACSSLWLAFHDDLADPANADPVARESTRLYCAAVRYPQTSLDPRQMKEWTPNSKYGAHAFGLGSFDEFLARREKILPWIKEYSPYELVNAGDPPVYLIYNTPPAMSKAEKDPTHTANFGVKLQELCRSNQVPCELVYPGAPNVLHASPTDYLIDVLKAK